MDSKVMMAHQKAITASAAVSHAAADCVRIAPATIRHDHPQASSNQIYQVLASLLSWLTPLPTPMSWDIGQVQVITTGYILTA